MPEVIFRLPGKAQYSYAEVKLSQEEMETYAEPQIDQILQEALDRLNAAYPEATANVGAGPQDERPASNVPEYSNGAKTTCEHGQRKQVKGGAQNNQWTAWFCPLDDKSRQCKAEFEKKGR